MGIHVVFFIIFQNIKISLNHLWAAFPYNIDRNRSVGLCFKLVPVFLPDIIKMDPFPKL